MFRGRRVHRGTQTCLLYTTAAVVLLLMSRSNTHLFGRRATGTNENPWVQLDNHVSPNAACNKDGALQFPVIAMSSCTAVAVRSGARRPINEPPPPIDSRNPPPATTVRRAYTCTAQGCMALSAEADETALELFRRANRKPLRTGLAFFDEVYVVFIIR